MKYNMILILSMISISSYAASSRCTLKKVFHHRADMQKKNSLEMGSVVLYCDQYPEIEHETLVMKNGHKQVRYFIPDVSVDRAANPIIASFNRINMPSYSARIATDAKRQGVMLTIEYDPNLIVVSYDMFQAITNDKGIIFRLYNHALLKALKAKEATMLKVSYAQPTVIIDCGHGGSDKGACGVSKCPEKDVVLCIGKELEGLLVAAGFHVCMIREEDIFVPLDERTSQANVLSSPALFISLHANFSPRSTVSGIETYCLAPSLFDHKLATSLDVLISPLHDELYHLSESFAQTVHQSLLAAVHKKYPDVIDRNIRHAVAQVLVGASMPATLVELGFLSHETEAQRMNDPAYQKLLAQGLFRGIKEFSGQH